VQEKKLADTAQAHVTLAEIPFVSLRAELPRALLEGRAGFAATVAAARAAMTPPELVLDPATQCVRMAGKVFRLAPAEFALLAVLAHRARTDKPALPAPPKEVADRGWAQAYLADLRAACGEMYMPGGVEEKIAAGADGNYLSQRLTRLNKALADQLDVAAAGYRIDRGSARRHAYRLLLAPGAISFARIESDCNGATHHE
jgi:hypothetical protein